MTQLNLDTIFNYLEETYGKKYLNFHNSEHISLTYYSDGFLGYRNMVQMLAHFL